MRIALAQTNSKLGDFSNNYKKALEYIQRAKDKHCDLVVFPECSLFGYHPMDLLESKTHIDLQLKELKRLQQKIPKGIAVLVGAIVPNSKKNGKPFHNAAVFLEKGKSPQLFFKQLLPTYDVFDDARHIEPGSMDKNILKFQGKKILVTVCEDIWGWNIPNAPAFTYYKKNPITQIAPKSVDLVINLSASPFSSAKEAQRLYVTRKVVAHFRKPLVYVNMVGAQDEIIFDGGSFALDEKGKKIATSVRFQEDLNVLDLATKVGGHRPKIESRAELLRQAIVLGIQDFVGKLGMERVHLGLSGGVDSAVVACLAVDALGADRVSGFALPGPFSAPESLTLAKKLAENLGIHFQSLPISPIYDQVCKDLENHWGKNNFGIMNENLQARLRCLLLMAQGNLKGSLLLNTSNKSELAMGYATQYGDLAGALCPIGDLYKTEVFAVANHYNAQQDTDKKLIPQRIIDRPPSAELRPNQKDSDSLPEYKDLDPILENLIENFKYPKSALEKEIYHRLMRSEFKRWQAPPVLKLSSHAFGRGRRFPIVNGLA